MESSRFSYFPLHCDTMAYPWGKVGPSSCIYKLLESIGESGLDPNRPYAELWMGDHPKAPSKTTEGKRICDIFPESPIPFLFKILSVAKPLSLQAHPSLEFAKILHARDPANFPDANHKPEMAVFITETTLLYGFRPYSEICHFLKSVPELKSAAGEVNSEAFINNPNSKNLKQLIKSVLSQSKDSVATLVQSFYQRFSEKRSSFDCKIANAIDTIYSSFPNDIGLLFPFILNVVVGQPGMSIFIPHGTLHAYLSGDLFEAMAVSDNVARAAMTPKHIDIEALIQTLEFEPKEPIWIKPRSIGDDSKITSIQPPINEFAITRVELGRGESVSLPPFPNHSIFLAFSGGCNLSGANIIEGTVLLIGQKQGISISSKDGCSLLFCSF